MQKITVELFLEEFNPKDDMIIIDYVKDSSSPVSGPRCVLQWPPDPQTHNREFFIIKKVENE